MIKLSTGSAALTWSTEGKEWESAEYTHTNSDVGSLYTLSHNFGQSPDLIRMYIKKVGYWYEVQDLVIESAYWGFQVAQPASPTLNFSEVRAFRADGQSTATIKFRCFLFGSVGSAAPFTWSSAEQVYPLEKATDGSTLYAKQIDYESGLPANGRAGVPHGVGSLVAHKMHRIEIDARSADNTYQIPVPYAGGTGYLASYQLEGNEIALYTNWNAVAYTSVRIRLVYKK